MAKVIKSIIAISLSITLLSFQAGCVGMTVKHVNPDEPNVMESNERVVFGRIIFITHSEKMGDISFAPVGLGLVHMETGKRATKAVMLEKFVSAHPVTGEPITHRLPKLQSEKLWFENDGTFYWVLPTGGYQIDALAWGHYGKVSAEDFTNPKTMHIFSLKPDNPPECGFVVSPNIVFNVSGDSGALYIGSLLIDMNIKIERGIEVKNINHIEIKDEYAEAMGLLKSHCPSFALTVEKRLMTSITDRSASFANRRCPTWIQMLFRGIVGGAVAGAILVAPVLIAPAAGPAIIIPAVPIGK
jgi:hypothetical protein